MGSLRHHSRRKSRSKPKPSLLPEVGEMRLPPEDDNGNVEYKPSATRLQHLVTQMKWRLQQGNGEAIYEIGVEDDGKMTGLGASDMSESMQTLCRMCSSVGANMLNDRVVHGKAGDSSCRRVIEVLVRKLPEDQQFTDLRIAVLGSASSGKSTLCGVLTQGVLDNGNGKCRLNLLRYMHEIRTGKTSSVNLDVFGFDSDGQVLNYKENSLEDILNRAAKLITLIDLAGDRKYLKTTIYGVSGYTPHYCALLVNARIGWTAISEEHLELATAFNIPVFVVITKTDLVSHTRIQKIEQQIQAVLSRCRHDDLTKVVDDDTCRRAANSITVGSIPLFHVSNVNGTGLSLLTSFIHQLPHTKQHQLLSNVVTRQPYFTTLNPPIQLFYIDEVFHVAGSGTVVCGLVNEGIFNEGNFVQVGPDPSGAYIRARIDTLRRNKQPVLAVNPGETVSMALSFESHSYGMVVISVDDKPVSCQRFVARFCLLSHSVKELCVGFQGTAYVGALRRTVTIVDFAADCLRSGDQVDVTFEFYGAPAFVRCGAAMFFRERDTKGMGKVLAVEAF